MINNDECILEANFEFVEQTPITIDLEIKKYFDTPAQISKEFNFDEVDWIYDEDLGEYTLSYDKSTHKFESLMVSDIRLWEDLVNRYVPSLCDYTVENVFEDSLVIVDVIVKLYSEEPCKGKITMFGQV